MPKAKTISLTKSDHPAYLEFDWLRAKGLEHIQQLSGGLWTDHNLHDPGITMLEALCYAVADIGYRTNLDIKDLLAEETAIGIDDNFFKAAEVLSSNPLTISDFRKLLMDVNGVVNAWLEVSKKSEIPLFISYDENQFVSEGAYFEEEEMQAPLELNGLFTVTLQLDENTTREEDEILKEAYDRLHAHRNLCEDFFEISILKKEKVGIKAKIYISPDARPEKVAAHIFQKIDNFLSPSIRFYTLKELLDKGRTIEEIFAGRSSRTLKELWETGQHISAIFSDREVESLKEYIEKGNKVKNLFSGSPIEVIRGMLRRGKTMEEIFLGQPIDGLNELLDTSETLKSVFDNWPVEGLKTQLQNGETLAGVFEGVPKALLQKFEEYEAELLQIFGDWPVDVLKRLFTARNGIENIFTKKRIKEIKEGKSSDVNYAGSSVKQSAFLGVDVENLIKKWHVDKRIDELFGNWRKEDLKYLFNKQQSVEGVFASWPIDILRTFLTTGQTVDELFNGRLFVGESHGFIDVKELMAFKRPTHIYVSDLYRVIMDEVYNVESVNGLCVFSESKGVEKWEMELPEYTVPLFSADLSVSEIVLHKSNIPVSLDMEEVVGRYKRRFSNLQKVIQPKRNLDIPIPKGQFRKDLEKYKSVQYELPSVYAVGKNGFSEKADSKRKAQSLQLKAYLLFFDQVLANYLGQLGNVRELFSLNKENNNRTYFVQSLADVPGSRKIINFLEKEKNGKSNNAEIFENRYFNTGDEIAVAVSYFDNIDDQEFYIDKIIYHFKENDTAFKYSQESGKFEVIDSRLGTVLLRGAQHYENEQKALQAYETICFLGTQRSSYEKEQIVGGKTWVRKKRERKGGLRRNIRYVKPEVAATILNNSNHEFIYNKDKNKIEIWDSDRQELILESAHEVANEEDARAIYEKELNARKFYFRLIYKPEGYLSFMASLREEDDSRDMYVRRNQFLDHLSSRFAHDFTDYVLLMYSVNNRHSDNERIISDKLDFLRHFPEISRDRSKGFDYAKEEGKVWGSDNVCGLKKRVASMMGLGGWKRDRLNYFKVVDKEAQYKFRKLNDRGELIWEGAQSFNTKKDAYDAYKKVEEWAKDEAAYVDVNFGTEGVYGFKLVNPESPEKEDVAYHPVTYRLTKHRNRAKQYMRYWFNGAGIPLKAIKKDKGWQYELYWEAYDRVPKVLLRSSEYFESREAAIYGGRDWLIHNEDTIKQAIALFKEKPVLIEGHAKWTGLYREIIDWKPLTAMESEEELRAYMRALDQFKTAFKKMTPSLLELGALDEMIIREVELELDALLKEEKLEVDEKLKKTLSRICLAIETRLDGLNTSIVKLKYDPHNDSHSFEVTQYGAEKAYHPEQYDSLVRRNVVLLDGLEFLANINHVTEIEYAGSEAGFVYQLTGDWAIQENVNSPYTYEEKILLESDGRFDTEKGAWDALDQLLAASVKLDKPNQMTDFSGGGGYSFNFVNEAYFFAEHPHFYPTLKLREKARDYIFQYVRKADVLYVDFEIEGQIGCHEGRWYSELVPIIYSGIDRTKSKVIGEVLWRCMPGYTDKKKVKINLLYFMEMAREPDFYLVTQKNNKFEVALLDYCDQTVAKAPVLYDSEEAARAAVLERIKYARLYPYVNLNYDPIKRMNDCSVANETLENVKVGVQLWYYPGENTQSPIPLEGVERPTNDAGIWVQEPRGALALEINQSYGSLEEAHKGLEQLKSLLKEKENLQRTETTECGPFSFHVVDAAEVMATHPDKYYSYKDLKKARDLTMENLNKEGFHLVEHILLRPRSGNKRGYSIQLMGQSGEALLLDTHQYAQEPTSVEIENYRADVRQAVQSELEELGREKTEKETVNPEIDLELNGKIIALGLKTPEDAKQKMELLEEVLNADSGQYQILEINAAFDAENLIDRFSVPGLRAAEVNAILEGKDEFERYLPNTDPYSFWATIVLPYWPKRFQNMNFRAFFENTIRMETPAHVALRIAWVDPQQMKKFEEGYEEWLRRFGKGVNGPMLEAQNNLLNTIQSLTNCLPLRQLGKDCSLHHEGEA